MKTFRPLLLTIILFAFTHTVLIAQTTANNPAFNKLIDEYYEEGLKLNPIAATQRGNNSYNDILPNSIAAPHLKKIYNYNIKYKELVTGFKRDKLNAFDKISFDIVQLQIKQALDRQKFHPEYMPFSHTSGLPLELPSLGSGTGVQPFKTVKDYNNWLKRLEAFPDWADTAISNFNKGISAGIVLPKALVVKMIPQLESQTNPDINTSIFYGPVRDMLPDFTETQRTELRASYHLVISNKIIPAYRRLADYLKNVYLPKARNTSGINARPNGAEYYRFLTQVFTTTDQHPAEIYNTGLKEVDRITKQIVALKNKVGFEGSLDSFYNYSITAKQFFPFTSEEQILNKYREILPKIQPHLNKLFNIIPKTAFEVKAIEKFKAATSAANYQRGTEDGSRPGYFNVPILEPEKFNVLGMENLFLHEAIPGHHFQLSLQQENKSLPKIRKFATYSAFSEGWALYTESLGKELGLYTDPYQELAAYKSELFRAIRLVTDVGLHTGKMTREEVIRYMVEKGGRAERGSVSETERYMANPGQALSYKIGEMKITELKARYQKKLGTRFNIKRFHDAVLLAGSLPLTVFETYMEEWVSEQRRR